MTNATAQDHDVVALTSRVGNVTPDLMHTAVDIIVQLSISGAKADGFWSGELKSPAKIPHEWYLVQRFRTTGDASKWLDSQVRKTLVEQLIAHTGNYSEEIIDNSEAGDAATIIVTDVHAGMEEHFFEWERQIQVAQAKSPGFKGAYLQPRSADRRGAWSTLVHYDSPHALESWFGSEERQKLLLAAEKLVKTTSFQKVDSSFPGWFPQDATTGKSPQNWKTALIVLLGLFPIVMLEMKFLSPLLPQTTPAMSTFLSLVLSVIITTWFSMPLSIKSFSWWLYPASGTEFSTNAKGLAVLLACFALELALTWNLVQRN